MRNPRTVKRALFHMLVCGIAIVASIGCETSDESTQLSLSDPVTPPISNVSELTSVLLAHTRGAMAVDMGTLLAGSSSLEVTDLLDGNGTDGALNEPFSVIKDHSLGMDIQEFMETALLVQTTNPQDGYILAAKLNNSTLAEVVNVGALTEGSDYKTHTIYSESSSGLNVTMLPTGLFIVGQSAGVESVIDVYVGDADNATTGAAVGPYLGDLAGGQSVTFVYGLPGLYQTISSGLTLNGSQAVSAWLSFSAGTLSGEASFYTANAVEFASTYNTATALNEQTSVTTLPAAAGKVEGLVVPIPTSDIDKSAAEIISSRHELKMLFYIMEARDNWAGIASGATQPWKNFFVDDEPPSIFVIYEFFSEQKVIDFSDAVLPAGFQMKKLKILETDTPTYFLAVNIYKALGIAAGERHEWVTFLKDPAQDKPRFMVFQAMSSTLSVDPTAEAFFTDPDPLTYIHENDQLISQARKDNEVDNYFSVRINWPAQGLSTSALPTREFGAANDFIYWGGGVCDRGLYSGSIHNRDVTVIPAGEYTITNDSDWVDYVNPVPKYVYVYQNALDILVSPWWNLDADYLDLTPERIQALIDFKRSMYTNFIELDINNAFYAQEDAITPLDVDNTIPAAFFNYVIPDSEAAAFEAALGLPSGYSLEKTQILESDAGEAYYLTLNVFETNNAIEGTRAEWSVYVDDGNGREYFMMLELMTEDAALDPVSLLNLPSVVQHNLSEGVLSTTLASSTIQFSATLNVADGVEELQTLDWVEAKDFVCYLNGICDKNYFGEGSLETPLLSINPASVTVNISTPWSTFIGSEPASVLLRTNKQLFAKKAWYNVQPVNSE